MNPIEQFREAIRADGLIPPDVIEPGKFHKFPGEGKGNGNTAAWCKLFADGIGGVYGDYSTGLSSGWQANRSTPYTQAERETFMRDVAEAKAQAEKEQAERQAKAATQADAIWDDADDATDDHPYLRAKEVKAHGLGIYHGNLVIAGMVCNDAVIVPMKIDGAIHSLQFIAPSGDRRFLSGGRAAGAYYVIGTADEIKSRNATCFAEGYATAATLYEATRIPTVAVFSAGNLVAVATHLRKKLSDKQIIICGDVDKSDTGQRAAKEAAKAVDGVVALPPFTLQELAADKPPSDWNDFSKLRGQYAVKQAIEAALKVGADGTATDPPKGNSDGNGIVVISLVDFVTRDIPPRERILAPWLLTQSLNMIYAWRGIGKTHVALGIAYATASGGSFLKWKAIKPRRVLYIDGEMPAASMQDRLKGLVASNDVDFDPDYFKLITPDLQTGAMPDLATADGQDAIDAVLGDTELIVIDNLSCLARSGGRENDAESWLPIQPWALRQRQQGRSVLFLHHSGKGGAQRGTSKKEDILDTVLTLKRPAEYNPADGAVFEVHFEKTRDMHGDDAEPFEARLQPDAQGQSAWAYSSVEDSTFDRVVTLANEGLSQKEIAEELAINKSNVSRHFRRATDAGLIQKGGKHDAF